MNQLITIPYTCKFLSDFIDVLPTHVLLNKGVTGCGGTTLELKAPRNSIILCPTKNLVENKSKYGCAVTGDTKNSTIDTYLKTSSIKYKKIIATYDSLERLMKLIPDYQNYFLLVDEYHLLFNDYSFRTDIILYILKHFREFNNWCFLTATPIKSEFILNELSNIDTITYKWEAAIPVHTKIIDTYFIQKELLKLIDYYTPTRNLHIFINSITTIRNITKHTNNYSYRIVCSEHQKRIKSDGINSEVKKLNFYTSCAFEGCDIYDKNGLCIIICDTNIATTILDISTKIRQICGRLRDSKYKDECVIILNSSKHRYANTPVQKFIQKVNESEQLGKVKEESLQHCSPIQMAAELKLYNKETYSNLYLNKFKDKIFYDVNLKKLDIYNYHLISEIYSNTISVISELKHNNFIPKKESISLSNNFITIKEGAYTYEQLKTLYEPVLNKLHIKWTNRVIKTYFPTHTITQKKVNRKNVKYYIFKS